MTPRQRIGGVSLDEARRGMQASAGAGGLTFAEATKAIGLIGEAMVRLGERVAAAMRIFSRVRWVLVVDDPGERRPASFAQLVAQMRDVVLHEFWLAAGEPHRSPGARWVRRTKS